MSNPLIVILDDSEDRRAEMLAGLENHLPDFPHRIFDNAPEMVSWIEAGLAEAGPLLVSLDHDLGPTFARGGERVDPGTGREVVDALCAQDVRFPVIVHTSNSSAGTGMMMDLDEAGFTPARVFPVFGADWVGNLWVPEIRRLLSL